MKYDCEVIRDLLPIYKDGVTNKKSNEVIEEHLKECEGCKEYYNDLNKSGINLPEAMAVENKSVVDYAKRIRKKRKKVLAIVASIIVILFLGISIMGYYIVTGGPPIKTSDIKDYGVFEDFKGYSNLYIFPIKMPESAQIDSYYYYQRDTFLDPTCQIYLEYSLSKEDFDAEVLRISKITEWNNSIVYDTENFLYPAYVTIFNNDHCYEYTLIDEEEHKIICVFTQFIESNRVKFDKKYLPKNFEHDKSSEGFNIYYDHGQFFERHKR